MPVIKLELSPYVLILSETDEGEDAIEYLQYPTGDKDIDDDVLNFISPPRCLCERESYGISQILSGNFRLIDQTVDMKNNRCNLFIVTNHVASRKELETLINPMLPSDSFPHGKINIELSKMNRRLVLELHKIFILIEEEYII